MTLRAGRSAARSSPHMWESGVVLKMDLRHLSLRLLHGHRLVPDCRVSGAGGGACSPGSAPTVHRPTCGTTPRLPRGAGGWAVRQLYGYHAEARRRPPRWRIYGAFPARRPPCRGQRAWRRLLPTCTTWFSPAIVLARSGRAFLHRRRRDCPVGRVRGADAQDPRDASKRPATDRRCGGQRPSEHRPGRVRRRSRPLCSTVSATARTSRIGRSTPIFAPISPVASPTSRC